MLAWVWAYREQLRLLDSTDIFFLGCAEKRCWNEDARCSPSGPTGQFELIA